MTLSVAPLLACVSVMSPLGATTTKGEGVDDGDELPLCIDGVVAPMGVPECATSVGEPGGGPDTPQDATAIERIM